MLRMQRAERDMIRFMESVILHLFIYAYVICYCNKIIICVYDIVIK